MAESNYASEYETDIQFLRSFDTLTTDILCKVKGINIFLFDIDIGREIDYTIDGDIYVYIRSEEPKHCVLVVNQKTKKYLREPITEDLCWENQKPVLIYRKGSIMFTIYFKTNDEFKNMADMVTSILQTSTGTSPRLSPTKPAQQQCIKEEKPGHVEAETSFIQTPNETILTKENDQNIDDKQIPVSPQINKGDMDKLVSALATEKNSKPKPILTPLLSVGDYTAFKYCSFPSSPATKSAGLTLKHPRFKKRSKENKKIEDPIHSGEASGPLSEEQLTEALVYMLKNDKDFSRKVYDEYLSNFKK